MSAKWRRSQAWDREHLTGVLTPLRIVLHELSSIRLAISLLVFVSLYAVLASVPIGLLALAPTWLLYLATLVIAVGLVAALPALLLRQVVLATAGRGVRFAVPVLVFLPLALLGAWLWKAFAWPAMHYDPASGDGFRLFPGFVEAYRSTTLRRLPGFEMSELEFYSWWPLRLVLLLFCVNMITATARRIEFTFKNLGVLTVHTGIITIALGSIVYQAFKQEGDTILLASNTGEGPGPAASGFYDNQRLALFVAQRDGVFGPQWEQRPIEGVPRYNPYDLRAGLDTPEDSLWHTLGLPDPASDAPERSLSRDVPDGRAQHVDPDLAFRIVGYAPYADSRDDWIRDEPRPGESANPLRIVELLPNMPDAQLAQLGQAIGRTLIPGEPLFRFTLLPGLPAQRVRINPMLGLEYRQNLDPERRAALTSNLPADTRHALLVTVPRAGGEPYRGLFRIGSGTQHTLGDTGFSLHVEQLSPEPPFPIITPGYENATSSVAVVHVSTPEGDEFDRWLYHRYPELDQDLLKVVGGQDVTQANGGRPNRVDADLSKIRITYLDASRLQVYFNEQTGSAGGLEAIIREPGGNVRVVDCSDDRTVTDLIAGLDLKVATYWDHARLLRRPVPTPEAERDNQFIGTHDRAMLAVEVSSKSGAFEPVTEWLEFSKYFFEFNRAQDAPIRTVLLPDGRSVRLAFGRLRRSFGPPTNPNPAFQVRMVDFEMIAYDHRGAPRDYQSLVLVEPTGFAEEFEPYEHTVKLNAPLRAPFHADPDAAALANLFSRLARGFDPGSFKLSQAGWDQQGWQETQQMVDQGVLDRPRAKFTILAVGNNPGIHVIALGSILMSVGIPWAFYVKPWLVRRERDRLKAIHAKPRAAETSPDQPAPESAPIPQEATA